MRTAKVLVREMKLFWNETTLGSRLLVGVLIATVLRAMSLIDAVVHDATCTTASPACTTASPAWALYPVAASLCISRVVPRVVR